MSPAAPLRTLQVDHVRVYRAADLLTRIGSRPVRSARGSRAWTRPKSRTPSAAIPTGPWLPGRIGTPFAGAAGGNGHVGDAQVGFDERAQLGLGRRHPESVQRAVQQPEMYRADHLGMVPGGVAERAGVQLEVPVPPVVHQPGGETEPIEQLPDCLLYTSDAADE